MHSNKDISIRTLRKNDCDQVSELLLEFRREVARLDGFSSEEISARQSLFADKIFDEVLNTPTGVVYVAELENELVGIISAYVIPQLRRGAYGVEVEEMFVVPEYQGRDVATMLVDSVFEWIKNKNVTVVRLGSDYSLKRAHSFYKKYGFTDYGKAFEIEL